MKIGDVAGVVVVALSAVTVGILGARAQPGHENDTKVPAPVSEWHVAFSLPTGSRPEKMAYSPDGRALFVWLGNEVQKWDLQTRRKLWTHKEPKPPFDFTLSHDGKTVALATASRVGLYSAATGKRTATLPVKAYAVAFSRDSKWLATASDNGHLTGKIPTRVAVALWRCDNWQRTQTLLAPLQNGFERDKDSFRATALDFSPDSRRVVVTTAASVLFEFEVTGKRVEHPWNRPTNFVQFAPDGKTAIGRWENVLTSESSDYSMSLFDPKSWENLNKPDYPANRSISSAFEFKVANCIAYAPDSQTIAVAFADGFLGLFDVPSGKLKTTIARAHAKYWSFPLAFSPDGRQLASGFWKQVDFWQRK